MSDSSSFGLFPDEHNRKLLENVHPTSWVNPEPQQRYHLVVIGGGTAGLVCAAGAAGLGARVALIERHLLGGDCLNVGCVPSKALLRAARAWHAVNKGQQRFAAATHVGAGDFAQVMERVRQLRTQISRNDGAPRFRELGVDVFLGDGHFVSPDAIEVAGQRLSFRRAVIATGGRPAVPPIPGLSERRASDQRVRLQPDRGAAPPGDHRRRPDRLRARPGLRALRRARCPVRQRQPDPAPRACRCGGHRAGVAGARRRAPRARARIAEVAPRGRDGRDKVLRFEKNGQSDEFVANEILVAAGRKPNIERWG
jgi:pyruvate/2-oxoglutarate dehydrogenase complex dihydrolipoamide dehydrogenase (E3) component